MTNVKTYLEITQKQYKEDVTDLVKSFIAKHKGFTPSYNELLILDNDIQYIRDSYAKLHQNLNIVKGGE